MEIKLYKNHTFGNVWHYFKCGLIGVVAALAALPAFALHRINPDQCEPLPLSTEQQLSVMDAFGQQTTGQALWSDPARLQRLVDGVDSLIDDGLDPADYHDTALKRALSHLKTWGHLPDCDRQLATDAYLRALADLHYGRAYNSQQPTIWYSPNVAGSIESGPWLKMALDGLDDPAQALADARPDSRRYRNLRLGYRLAREQLPDDWPEIPPGPTLARGDWSERVALIRERLAEQDYRALPPAQDSLARQFDDNLDQGVRDFQERHSLKPDGKVGPATLAELNISPRRRLEQIRANLERLRWLAREMEDTLVLVDIAAARIEFYENGEVVWSGRAQVGQPERATPELKSVITHVTVNPHWTMPRSIFLRDALPSILGDPDYLLRRRIRVYDRIGLELMQSEVDWDHPEGLTLRQDPGPGNALGRVVIRFSNPFAVYLHDTPAAGLFNRTSRFYSSGCVRVEDAMSLTERLFRDASPTLRQEFELARASGESHNVHLPRGVYILMAYWTAEADSTGRITYRPDVYGSDRPLLALLGSP